MATTKGYDSIMIEEEMPLLRYAGILKVLQESHEGKITLDLVNRAHAKGEFKREQHIIDLLERKTEEFVVCGFDSNLDPFLLSDVEREALVKVKIDILVEESKTKTKVMFSLLSSLVESLTDIFIENSSDIKKNTLAVEQKQLRSEKGVEALGKQHMEKAERERLAGRTTTSIPS